MKRIFTSLFLASLSLISFSQFHINRVDKYEIPSGLETIKTVSITMPYGQSTVLSIEGDTTALRQAGDIQVDIVCTDFPSSQSLTELNTNRIKTLYQLFPFIKHEQIQKIEVVRQMGGSEKSKAVTMFHGVIISFRPPQTKETMLHDLSKLEEIISADTTDKSENETVLRPEKKETAEPAVEEPIKQSSDKEDTLQEDTLIHRSAYVYADREKLKKLGLDTGCYINMTPREALKLGLLTKEEFNGSEKSFITKEETFEVDDGNKKLIKTKYSGYRTLKTITIVSCATEPFAKGDFLLPEADTGISGETPKHSKKIMLQDSTVIGILKRNKWQHMDVVCDVTGSMYPYTAQLLLWLKLQSSDSSTNTVSFFNDGDDMPDNEKRLGKTGGIYAARCDSFPQVVTLIKTAMLSGGGGDCPENNVEALLDAEKKFPDKNFHVLIADNWAPVKDISIAGKLKKPVRIVLCGVYNNEINTDYLDLARMTGGSVHLIEQDLINLASMHEGETLRIGRKKFKIMEGHFQDISEPIDKDL